MKMKKDVYYCIVLSDSQLDFWQEASTASTA